MYFIMQRNQDFGYPLTSKYSYFLQYEWRNKSLRPVEKKKTVPFRKISEKKIGMFEHTKHTTEYHYAPNFFQINLPVDRNI